MSRPEDRLLPGLPIDGAVITADDVERSKLAWEKSAPERYRKLLEAQPEEPK